MRSINLKLVVATTTTFAVILYVVCVALRPLFPTAEMYAPALWAAIFPGFSWTPGGVLLGGLETIVTVALLSALYVGLYDLFGRRLAPSPR